MLEILPERTTIEGYEVVHRFNIIGEKTMLLNARKIERIDELILLAIEDITDRKKAEQEREDLITELRKAISEIKTLRGILPICSFCKNIRNDEGYYEQIEAYIHHHSGVDFSHTICPKCLKQHYPREHKAMEEEKGKK